MMAGARADFPVLANRRIGERAIIYMDSAATSLVPKAVLDAQYQFASSIGASVHRSRHALGDEASFTYAAARQRVARFLNADPACIVLTSGATEALNCVARGLPRADDELVLVPATEHHANLVPWFRRGRTRVFSCDSCQPLTPARLNEELRLHRPSVVAFGFVSNVTGVVHPVAELCALARTWGALTVVDASQAVAHLPIDVEALGADFLVFSAHKMFGPFGTGVLWGRRGALESLDPLLMGGGAVDAVTGSGHVPARIPERLEAGTPNVTGVIGLAAAVDYLEGIGWGRIVAHDAALASCLEEELRRTPGIRPLVASGPARVAIGSFGVISGGLVPERVATLLSDTENIMVRVGKHCAHPLFAQENLSSAVRVSLSIYNTVEEVRHFGEVLRRILGRFAQ